MSKKVLVVSESWVHQYDTFDPDQKPDPYMTYLRRVVVMKAAKGATVESIVREYESKLDPQSESSSPVRSVFQEVDPVMDSLVGEDDLVFARWNVRALYIMIKGTEERHPGYSIRDVAEEAIRNRDRPQEGVTWA